MHESAVARERIPFLASSDEGSWRKNSQTRKRPLAVAQIRAAFVKTIGGASNVEYRGAVHSSTDQAWLTCAGALKREKR